MEHPIRAHDTVANALISVDGNIPERRVNANFSRLSCLHLSAKIWRHHPLTPGRGQMMPEGWRVERCGSALTKSTLFNSSCQRG
jgi:hypothetical protein